MRESICITTLLVAALTSATLAADINPPEYRGNPKATLQSWDFLDSGFDGYYSSGPDGTDENPYDTPELTVIQGTWSDEVGPSGAPGGAWSGFSEIYLNIPEGPDRDFGSIREARFQITYLAEAPADAPSLDFDCMSEWTLVSAYSEHLEEVSEDSSWYVHTIDLESSATYAANTFSFNPAEPGVQVSQVILDYAYVPEPATAVVLLAGGALLLYRRRR
ncbi:MAG: PEP-CTERM sorting domain-containing protein [Phycisphaerae bacterium]